MPASVTTPETAGQHRGPVHHGERGRPHARASWIHRRGREVSAGDIGPNPRRIEVIPETSPVRTPPAEPSTPKSPTPPAKPAPRRRPEPVKVPA